MACKHNIVHRAFALMAALLTVLTVSCYCAGEKVFAASSQKGVVTVNALNVRKSPGTQNAVINVIYKGDSVEIVRTENGWHRILLGRNKYGGVRLKERQCKNRENHRKRFNGECPQFSFHVRQKNMLYPQKRGLFLFRNKRRLV